MKKKWSVVALSAMMMAAAAMCCEASPKQTENTEAAAAWAAETEAAAADTALPSKDPAGNEITVPEKVDKIISMAPSVTRLLIDLGISDKLVGVDTYSEQYYGDELPENLPAYDMMQPDNESIVALKPDIVFTTGMSSSGGTDVYAAVRVAGICTADIPSASSLDEIGETITFVGDCTGTQAKAEAISRDYSSAIADIKKIGDGIPKEERKSVLYEISTPTSDSPAIYSAGKDTYITEAITDIGAVSLTADQEDAWPSISEEAAIAMNPDVILTTDNYTKDVVDTLLSLTGWENVTAVKNKDVYYIDANLLNQPNQHVVSAMIDMAKDIYPEAYAGMEDPFAQ